MDSLSLLFFQVFSYFIDFFSRNVTKQISFEREKKRIMRIEVFARFMLFITAYIFKKKIQGKEKMQGPLAHPVLKFFK